MARLLSRDAASQRKLRFVRVKGRFDLFVFLCEMIEI